MKSSGTKNSGTGETDGRRLANRQPERGRSALGRRSEAKPEAAWQLPGGVRLAEFALSRGFMASSLLARGNRER